MLTLRRVAAALLLLAGAFGTVLVVTTEQAGAARRDDQVICTIRDPDTGECVATITTPGAPPTGQPPPPAGGAAAGPAPQCKQGDTVVPCSSPVGAWSNELQCYLQEAVPPPPADDPAWAGHFPDGAVYLCEQNLPGQAGGLRVTLLWQPGPPKVPTLSPEDAARTLVARLGLRAVQVGSAPEPGPDRLGLVGLPVWLWAADPGRTTTGPATLTAAAGGRAVTLTAGLDRITWGMGDGASVVCTGPGTPYATRFGVRASPDCGYRYTRTSRSRPGGAYPVTATSDWSVAWASGTARGVIGLQLASTTSLRIGEAQALVTG